MTKPRRSSAGSAIVGFVLGFAIAALAAFAIWGLLRGWSTPRIDASRPAVVRQIQQLHRLETVVYAMDKIVAGGQESRYLPTFLVGERLLLIVYGEVTAGVDLGRIDPEDVTLNAKSVLIRIPPAEIFSTRIDNERTRVYSRETGLFTRMDPNLESDMRREAELQIRQSALDGGILQAATANARTTLTAFLRGLGFEQAEVQ